MAIPSPTYAGAPALVAIGGAIRAARLKKSISQERLAHDAGVDRSYLGGIERGEHNLTLMNLLRIAKQLEMNPSELLSLADL